MENRFGQQLKLNRSELKDSSGEVVDVFCSITIINPPDEKVKSNGVLATFEFDTNAQIRRVIEELNELLNEAKIPSEPVVDNLRPTW